jgi:transcription-repair coupling factor (superfamily II helicase)
MSSLVNPRLPKTKQQRNVTDRIKWNSLTGSAKSLAIAKAAQTHTGPLIVITQDTAQAYQLEKEIRFFSDNDDLSVNLFPHWETLPYDHFSPHQDIVSKRLETLYLLSKKHSGVYLVPVSTLLQKIAPVEYVGQHLLYLEKGQTLEPTEFRRNLEKSGYLAYAAPLLIYFQWVVINPIESIYLMTKLTLLDILTRQHNEALMK